MTPRSLVRSSLVILTLVLVGTLLVPDTTRGQRIALSSRVSTLGIGEDVTVRLTNRFNVRAGGSYFPYRDSGMLQKEVDVRYDVNARLAAALLFLDWHPFGNAFRVSVGGVYNETQIQGHARPVERYTIREKTFEPEKLGSLDAEASFASKLNPYLGIGFGNSVRGSRFDLFVDLGAIYVARPEVKMTGSGLISATTNHASTLNDALGSFHLFPYLSLGFSLAL